MKLSGAPVGVSWRSSCKFQGDLMSYHVNLAGTNPMTEISESPPSGKDVSLWRENVLFS